MFVCLALLLIFILILRFIILYCSLKLQWFGLFVCSRTPPWLWGTSTLVYQPLSRYDYVIRYHRRTAIDKPKKIAFPRVKRTREHIFLCCECIIHENFFLFRSTYLIAIINVYIILYRELQSSRATGALISSSKVLGVNIAALHTRQT